MYHLLIQSHNTSKDLFYNHSLNFTEKISYEIKKGSWKIVLTTFQIEEINNISEISKTSNNEQGWTPVTYLNVLHRNVIPKQLQHFFLNGLQKYYQLPILGTFDMSGYFHPKRWCQLFFLIGLYSTQGWKVATRHGVTRKRSTKKIPAYRKSV